MVVNGCFNDAMGLANLAAHELLRASFIPPQPIRQLSEPDPCTDNFCQGPHQGLSTDGKVFGILRNQTLLGGFKPD